MKSIARMSTGLVSGVAVLAVLTACNTPSQPAPEVDEDAPTTTMIAELREYAVTLRAEEQGHHLCALVRPSLSAWRTNSVRAARASFNAAVMEWSLRHNVSTRSIMHNPHDIDITMAKACRPIWEETKLALATDNLADIMVSW